LFFVLLLKFVYLYIRISMCVPSKWFTKSVNKNTSKQRSPANRLFHCTAENILRRVLQR
jgi:hypothetical protein